jgi:biotin carboxyl carrier protein
VLAAAALERQLTLAGRGTDPWDQVGGWRVGEHAWTTLRVDVAGRETAEVRVRGAEVVVGQGEPVRVRAEVRDGELVVGTRRYAMVRDGRVLWLGSEGRSWALTETEPLESVGKAGKGAAGPVTSPMPGTVLVVRCSIGDFVVEGQALFVVEAMKMEHTVVAPVDGVLAEVNVRAGQQVALDQMSDNLKNAAVAGEDRRFYEHGGIDIPSVARAALGQLTKTSGSGASTITMQLVRNIRVQEAFNETNPDGTPVSDKQRNKDIDAATYPDLGRKLQEMKYAIGLEKK